MADSGSLYPGGIAGDYATRHAVISELAPRAPGGTLYREKKMNRSIRRYCTGTLSPSTIRQLWLPENHKIIHVGTGLDDLYLWAEVDDSKEIPIEIVAHTEGHILEDDETYVGTILDESDIPWAYHIYEKINK